MVQFLTIVLLVATVKNEIFKKDGTEANSPKGKKGGTENNSPAYIYIYVLML